MSLVQDIADYIAANSSLVVDTDLFVGGETVDTPSGSVIVREFAGSTKNESGLEERAIQILALDLGYINAETIINTVYALFANKPGFASTLTGIFFVSVVSMPGFIDRDQSGNYVFSTSLLFKKS
uniref:Tail protein n=1 Tax=viral metagenome TaxID=1070528 RepID=A0A6M3M4H8_9ZZZZ